MNNHPFSRIAVLLFVMLAASCARVARSPTEPAPGIPGAPVVPRGATLYRVSSADSSVHIRVYRGGTLSNLGHNHVISSKSVAGQIWTHASIEKSGFDLVLPVSDLIVDDNEARAAAGAEFPLNVPDDAKQGTRRNMLGEAVLDAAHYPRISLQSVAVRGSMNVPQVTARITIKTQSREVLAPLKLALNGKELQATGEFEIKQTDFGIKPYSVALGALAVQDGLKIKFELRAVAL